MSAKLQSMFSAHDSCDQVRTQESHGKYGNDVRADVTTCRAHNMEGTLKVFWYAVFASSGNVFDIK